MFKLTDVPIMVPDLRELTSETVGGIVTFEGRVRISNNDRQVSRLEYEAFAEMAELEGKKVLQEAMELFSIEHALCIHRTGTLELRELAVWIAVFAKHREAAYRANEYIIDQVKTRVPIWKKEYYEDGQTDWVKCLSCAAKGVPHHEHYHHRE